MTGTVVIIGGGLAGMVAALTAAGEESRGAFQRNDFPQEDNEHWRINSCVSYDRESDGFAVRYVGNEE